MQRAYRICFFEDGVAHAVAVLVLHFSSDTTAAEEARHLLSVSALSRVEVWRGTRKVHHCRLAAGRAPLASCSLHV